MLPRSVMPKKCVGLLNNAGQLYFAVLLYGQATGDNPNPVCRGGF
jgi:hypothetical protein